MRPPLGTRVDSRPHPSRGGNPYSQDLREQVITMWMNSDDILDDPWLAPLRHQHKFPSRDTCKRWIQHFQTEGNILPKQATGNNFSQREIGGQDLVNLALFCLVRPKSTIDECRAYINNRNHNNLPYSPSQIHRAECRLGLVRKAASTTSDLAYLPMNLHKRERYWTATAPDGVVGESTRDIVDFDESNYKLESQNRKFGKGIREKRCNTWGKFVKGAGSSSLLMAISGDDIHPFSFHQIYTEGGTDLWRFYNFLRDFIDWLLVHRPGRAFLFTMDNLNIHKHPIILNLIFNSGHRVVFRALYWSCDGPIEYVFNTIGTRLQMDPNGVSTVDQLVNKINNIIEGFTSFKRYFIHCGFPDN